MRPAGDDEAEMLAHWKPIMILNKTLRGPAYVESLVSHSPTLITSDTQGRKILPLEIWYLILDFITNDPDPHDYNLVRPINLKVDGKWNRTLVCVKVERWLSLSQLEGDTEVDVAQKYIARPDLVFDNLPCPFLEFGAPSTRWEIPARVLSSRYKTVHVAVTVLDIVKYVEEGRCNLYLDGFLVYVN
ncbi:hypothetical protein FPOAC1_006161 [Fusarium poae]|uniref:hypothetical protein n=1 Tax=Fusarium poae TaxID=36050 RepID=UPI001CE7E3A1|nr:hypothetical protein FPOAC1_006161 [Fusarium poae]KAG8672866.1 hypothetical protein FPOAC1_006161 [Fusarium poae]